MKEERPLHHECVIACVFFGRVGFNDGMVMNFASDNWAGVAEQVADSLQRHRGGFSPAYGESDLDREVEKQFNEVFEKEVAVFFVGTGTAANSLALSAVSRPGGFVLCHRESHLIEDECGAPEFFTAGGRMAPIDGPMGKMGIETIKAAFKRIDPEFIHHGQPMAVSLTQATEAGSTYSVDQISEIAEISHSHGVPLHMDGARFANALVSLGVTPAEMTWKSGVDALSFGATKNGCWCAEAIVFFDPEKARQMPFIRKRAAQLFSKTRFITAQLNAYLKDDLWLQLATHANEMAKRLIQGIESSADVKMAWSCESNELFVTMPTELAEDLEKSGAKFYPWPVPCGIESQIENVCGLYRLVTSFATQQSDIDQFIDLLDR